MRSLRFVSVVVLLAMTATTVHAADLRVLLVGSSHTSGISNDLRDVYDSVGVDATVDQITGDGKTLREHIDSGLLETLHTGKSNNEGPYDWVVIQEAFTEHGANHDLPADSIAAALEIKDEIDDVGNGGRMAIYLPFPQGQSAWTSGSYRSTLDNHITRASAFSPAQCPSAPGWPAACGTCWGYAPLAHGSEFNIRIAPIGEAIARFHEDAAHVYSELFTSSAALHLNSKGNYFAALTMFATIEQTLPDTVWHPTSLNSVAADYKRIARQTVLGPLVDPVVWNLWKDLVCNLPAGNHDASDADGLVSGGPATWQTTGSLAWSTGNTVVGLHFDDVPVPADATIPAASLEAAKLTTNTTFPLVCSTYTLLPNQTDPPFTANWQWMPQWPIVHGIDSLNITGGGGAPIGQYQTFAYASYGLQQVVNAASGTPWSGVGDVTFITDCTNDHSFSSYEGAPSGKVPRLRVRYVDN